MAERTLTVVITGDPSRLKSALDSSESRLSSFSGKARAFGEKMTAAGRRMSIGITLPVVAALRVAFNELGESEKLAAITEAHIKSTGGIANVTAKHVDKLTASLLRKTGIDDEVVRTGANMLLTFKNVRNEAGKGNDIFDRATKAALDLSFEFGSVDSAAKGVGKALNDPIKGMTALSKSGITFSKGQQDVIKWLVASGDVLGAQKIILGEIESQVGGTADAYGKTMPGQISRTIESLKNLGAEILTQLMPAIQRFAEIGLGFVRWFRDLPGPVQTVVLVLGLVAAVAGPLVYVIGALSTAVGIFAGVLSFLLSPIGLVITAIVLIGVALTALGVNWGAVWDWIKNAAVNAWNWINNNVVQPLVAGWGWIKKAALDTAGWLAGAWENIKKVGRAGYLWFKKNVIDPLVAAWDAVWSAVNDVLKIIKDVLSAGKDVPGFGKGGVLQPPGLASGGYGSGPTWVGEKGPELLDLPPGSYVHDHATSMAMASARTTRVYQLNVSVPPGGEAEAGRRIVSAIQAFENVDSAAWRN